MKKIVIVLSVLTLALGLAACKPRATDGTTGTTTTDGNTSTTTTTTPTQQQ